MKRYSKKLLPAENAERYLDNQLEIMGRYGPVPRLSRKKREEIIASLVKMVWEAKRR